MSHIILPSFGGAVPTYPTPGDLTAANPGDVAVVLTPLSLWVSDGSTWVLLATLNPIDGVSDSATIDLALSTNPDGTRTLSASVINASLVDAQISPTAGITLSKLAALTPSRALVSDGSGVIGVSSVTSIEIGYLSGVTSGVQGQLDGLQTQATSLQTQVNAKVAKAGDTMTGALTLPSAPTTTLHAATKGYVDDVGAAVIARVNDWTVLPSNPVAGDLAFTKDTQTLWEFGGEHWHELGSGFDSTPGTGLLSGGALSGVGTSQVTIAAGAGALLDFDHVGYAARSIVAWTTTNLTPGADGTRYIIGTPQLGLSGKIYSTIVISDTPTPPTRAQARSLLLFGKAEVTAGIVTSIRQGGDIAEALPNQFNDLMLSLGLFLASGCVISPNANLTLSRTAGSVFAPSVSYGTDPLQPHNATIAAENPVQLYVISRSSSPTTPVTNVPVANFDSSGTITAIPTNRFSNFRLFQHYDGRLFCQYGQQTYATLTEAIDGIQSEAYIANPLMNTDNVVLVAILSCRQNVTNLQQTTISRVIRANKFGFASGSVGLSSTTLQQAYINSSDPEITTDTTRGALQLRQGSGAPSSVLQVENSSGNSTGAWDATGALGLGTTTTPVSVASSPILRAYGTGTGAAGVELRMDGGNRALVRLTSIGGTESAPANTPIGSLQSIFGRGRFSGSELPTAGFNIETKSTTSNTSNLIFYTGNGGGIAERMRLDENGMQVASQAGTGTRLVVASSAGLQSATSTAGANVFDAGTYSATLGGATRCSVISPVTLRYNRIGSLVMISGSTQVTLTTDNNSSLFTITVPNGWNVVAASGTAVGDAGGATGKSESAAITRSSGTLLVFYINKTTGYYTGQQTFYFTCAMITDTP